MSKNKFSRAVGCSIQKKELQANFENYFFEKKFGGDDRDRTCDPQNANLMLSQLSYIPISLIRERAI